ncbi:hypothetical protein AAHA92_04393 [Salvia divinorum]|uniref:Uncharacterized protein n=1 Tax=Salvia divinorum TaxID=28513 RepID=A0ABD1I2L2_SALDI
MVTLLLVKFRCIQSGMFPTYPQFSDLSFVNRHVVIVSVLMEGSIFLYLLLVGRLTQFYKLSDSIFCSIPNVLEASCGRIDII